jgi:predicted small integral membrane protein
VSTPTANHTEAPLRVVPEPERSGPTGILLFQTLILTWAAAWLTLVVTNNINDFGTNRSLIAAMFSMDELAADAVLGNGIEWRAMPEGLAVPALIGVIAYQLLSITLLWRGAVFAIKTLLRRDPVLPARALRAANLGLTAFAGLFVVFLCGGMWFGYWMKMGPVQMVHLTGLIIALLAAIVVNLPVARERS